MLDEYFLENIFSYPSDSEPVAFNRTGEHFFVTEPTGEVKVFAQNNTGLVQLASQKLPMLPRQPSTLVLSREGVISLDGLHSFTGKVTPMVPAEQQVCSGPLFVHGTDLLLFSTAFTEDKVTKNALCMVGFPPEETAEQPQILP